MFQPHHNEHAAQVFARRYPDEVQKMEAAGIDWKSLFGKIGPILLSILADLLKRPGP